LTKNYAIIGLSVREWELPNNIGFKENKMRDKSRIRPFLLELETTWESVPDMRFGQLIYILAEYIDCGDIFFPEDDKWLEAMKAARTPDYSQYALKNEK